MFITSKTKKVAAGNTAWAHQYLDNRNLYYAELVQTFIKVDKDIIKMTYEWVVRKTDDEHFYYTVPLSVGFPNRNCSIIEEKIVPASETPFLINDAIVVSKDGSYEVVKIENEPHMVIFDGHEIKDV